MQDVDGPPHIQALPEPASTRRPSVEPKAVRFMNHPKRLDGLLRHRGSDGTSGKGRPSGRRNRSAPSGPRATW
jgi:hypothetical protein